ncbi:hypothetical protein Tco_1127033 [Tanacetum coccineum]
MSEVLALIAKGAFWSLNEDILKITILKTNTSYPSRKIRRIYACTHQRPYDGGPTLRYEAVSNAGVEGDEIGEGGGKSRVMSGFGVIEGGGGVFEPTCRPINRKRQRGVLVKMDDLNITMEEYIMLEEEKARRRGKVYNWETTTYGKICNKRRSRLRIWLNAEFPAIVFNDSLTSEAHFCVSLQFKKGSKMYDKVNMPLLPSPEPTVSYFDDLDFFKDFENEFPAIVYNDAQTSKFDLLTEPILNPQHIDEFNLKDETSLSECDEEEQNIVYTAYPNPMDTSYRLSGRYPVFIFNTVYTAYSLNEYGVYVTGIDTAYPGDLVKEISTNIGGEFTNLEILKCWSLETSRQLFNTQSCS